MANELNGVYKFTPQVQLKILALLWQNNRDYNKYREIIKPKYFQSEVHIDLCRILFDYYDKYNKPPTKDVLVEEVTVMCSKSKVKSALLGEFLKAIDNMSTVDLGDEDYVTDKLTTFGKRQALVDAILESVDILEKKPETEYSNIETLVRTALTVGDNAEDLGVFFFDTLEERIMSYTLEEDVIERFKTNMHMLDLVLKGGLGRTEMGVVVAPPGRGKTTFLVSCGAAALDEGNSVLHISLENNEKQILRNYDTAMVNKSFNYIVENQESVIAALNNNRKYKKGTLVVKKYPTKSVTIATIRRLLDRLAVVNNFKPDLLVLDYGALLKPMKSWGEKRESIESAYEDIRALADDYNMGVWTAAQGNRTSLSKKIVTMADLAECFAIANICDVMVSLCQTAEERKNSDMRLFLAKVRDGEGEKTLAGTVNYETKRMQFDSEYVGDSSDGESEDWDDEQ